LTSDVLVVVMPAWILWGGLIAVLWSLFVAYTAASMGWASRVPLPEPAEPADPELGEKLDEPERLRRRTSISRT
jgi:hypothetical protein